MTGRLATVCPACGRANDAHTDAAGTAAVPAPGDLSVCLGCAGVAVFDRGPGGGLVLRWPTIAEYAEASDEVRSLRRAVREVRAREVRGHVPRELGRADPRQEEAP